MCGPNAERVAETMISPGEEGWRGLYGWMWPSDALLRDFIFFTVVETAESLSGELYVRTTLAPRVAKSRAMLWPIPRDAPVTMAIFPNRDSGVDIDGVVILRERERGDSGMFDLFNSRDRERIEVSSTVQLQKA